MHPTGCLRRFAQARMKIAAKQRREKESIMRNTNKINVPEARQAMANMKQEVANELGINLKQGYNGDLSSKDAGHIGGNMVKKMIEAQERAMSGNR